MPMKKVSKEVLVPNGLLGVVLLVLAILSKAGGFSLPSWACWLLGGIWLIQMFGLCVHFELFRRIGGWAVLMIGGLITVGMLGPKHMVGAYPKRTAVQVSQGFSETWNQIIHKDVFDSFTVKDDLVRWLDSLGRFDPYETGQLVLFTLLGVALGICFLFPLLPVQEKERKEFVEWKDRLEYWKTFLWLLVGGTLWGLQVELLQVLSPSRQVVFAGALESMVGVLVGLFLFGCFHLVFWTFHRRMIFGRRFNIMGVGIEAVNMQDCLELFEEIIESGSCGVEEYGSSVPDADSSAYAYPSQDETGTLDLGEQGSGMGVSECGSAEVGARSSAPSGSIPHTPQPPNTLTLSSGLRTKLPAMTTAMGVAGIVESRRKQHLQRILNESVLNTPDGMPLVWLGRLYGYRGIERVYGPDLLRDACAYGEDKGWRHYFWGAAPGIVEKLKVVLEEKHPKIEISGICCPPFRPLTEEEEDALVEEVNASNTDIFWIGISTPKQLYFMDHIRSRLKCKIICPVGYAFDVNAGVEIDAPDWIKYSGLQWLHRGIKQPRLWKRYLPDNPMFVLKVFAQIFHLKKFPMFCHNRPIEPCVDAEGYPRFPAGVVALSAMTLEGARDRVINWIKTGQRHYVNICTADTVVQCYDRPDMAQIVMNAGMATTDGMPLVWLAKRFGFSDATRVYGPDLMLELCRASEENGSSHYFYGATDEVLAELKTNLLEKFPKLKIAGMYSPPFRPLTDAEKDEVSERINAAEPDIVWCGLGTPKQDYWVAEFRPRLKCAAILAVGAAFNFHAGHVRQAPRWMMKNGLEWLFRLVVEPRRLWRRYIIGNPRFLFQTFKQVVRAKRIRKRMCSSNG